MHLLRDIVPGVSSLRVYVTSLVCLTCNALTMWCSEIKHSLSTFFICKVSPIYKKRYIKIIRVLLLPSI